MSKRWNILGPRLRTGVDSRGQPSRECWVQPPAVSAMWPQRLPSFNLLMQFEMLVEAWPRKKARTVIVISASLGGRRLWTQVPFSRVIWHLWLWQKHGAQWQKWVAIAWSQAWPCRGGPLRVAPTGILLSFKQPCSEADANPATHRTSQDGWHPGRQHLTHWADAMPGGLLLVSRYRWRGQLLQLYQSAGGRSHAHSRRIGCDSNWNGYAGSALCLKAHTSPLLPPRNSGDATTLRWLLVTRLHSLSFNGWQSNNVQQQVREVFAVKSFEPANV